LAKKDVSKKTLMSITRRDDHLSFVASGIHSFSTNNWYGVITYGLWSNISL